MPRKRAKRCTRKGRKQDPAVKQFPVKRTSAGLLGTNVERVVAVRAPSRKRLRKNADDQAVVLSYRKYPSGKRSRGSVKVVDVDEAYERFER